MTHFVANWAVPTNISALTTTRFNGVSLPPFNTNNLALHVGDQAEHVHQNRILLQHELQLPNQPIWLEQTHSNHCILVEHTPNRCADAAISRSYTHPLAIMTADCLPILLCNQEGTEIAAIHAGWRGLLNGIIENTIRALNTPSNALIAWIGPAICANCYPTGADVELAFTARYSFAKEAFFVKQSQLHANLPKLAELILNEMGILNVFQSNACTFELTSQFYSYRKSAQTGRMATLIWFNQPTQ